MKGMDFLPFWLTLKLAFWTTLILLIIGIPIGYYLAYTKYKINLLFEAIINLPLVIPPTVLGFYLLLILNPKGIIGSFWHKLFGKSLVFHFEGIVVASVIYCFPVMINPLVSGFRSVPKNLIEVSLTLGKSKLETLIRVILPNMKFSVLTGIVLTFAHTLGEFGIVLMIGGSIEGETKVVSIAIYDAVEKLDYSTAHIYSAILLIFSLLTILSVYILNRRLSSDQA
ncbi:MAG: molybdate ABC transporter permease subunit [Caldimicrobium thiodismutans]|uniref:Molybdenum transport system permease n=1 Tax=Caldimicrobium thiodismutans TaxID=1653476 RepID=A0A2N7PKL7_9BACT|nr:MAG: molybdate ABC transporter permease subunit [Caldimicrobium thiodismutans]